MVGREQCLFIDRRAQAHTACLDWTEHKRVFSVRTCPPWDSRAAGWEGKDKSLSDGEQKQMIWLLRMDLGLRAFIFLLRSLVSGDFPDSGGKIPTRISKIVLLQTVLFYFTFQSGKPTMRI